MYHLCSDGSKDSPFDHNSSAATPCLQDCLQDSSRIDCSVPTTLVVIVAAIAIDVGDSGGSSAEDLHAPIVVIVINGSELCRQPSSGPLACCLCAAKHPNVSNLHHRTIIICRHLISCGCHQISKSPSLSIICCHPLSSHYCRRHSTSSRPSHHSHSHAATTTHVSPNILISLIGRGEPFIL